jgi:hypothetical protein
MSCPIGHLLCADMRLRRVDIVYFPSHKHRTQILTLILLPQCHIPVISVPDISNARPVCGIKDHDSQQYGRETFKSRDIVNFKVIGASIKL